MAPAAAPATSADGGVAAGGFTFGGGDTVTATSDAKADAGDAAVGAGFTFGGDTGDTVSFGSFGGDGDGTADGGFSFGSTDAGGDAGGFTFDASSFSEPIQEGYLGLSVGLVLSLKLCFRVALLGPSLNLRTKKRSLQERRLTLIFANKLARCTK